MGAVPVAGKVDILWHPVSISCMIAMLPFPDISPEIFSVTLFGFDICIALVCAGLHRWHPAGLATGDTGGAQTANCGKTSSR